ncbi:MAG: 4-hydroxythreonine-4-phosphate dehydrogenase PdxA [Lautropia sp.]
MHSDHSERPDSTLRIGVTMGDPAGIGPEILVAALARLESAWKDAQDAVEFVIYGDPTILRREADRAQVQLTRWRVKETSKLSPIPRMGQVSATAGEAAYRAIAAAADDARTGKIDAVVTAPISKAALNLAGHHHPGHTEILAEAAGGVPVRMMLANDELAVVLDSIHVPLKRAVEELSTAHLEETIRVTHLHCRRDLGREPRIAVAGLNPHAGEGGLLGDEERTLITPAITTCRRDGIDVDGPFAPDTVFMNARGFRQADVVIALYHDQGLIPVKYLGVDAGVNITIGLPFVRTSPDHGTAFDIVGTGKADPASMMAAIRVAIRLARAARATRSATDTQTRATQTPRTTANGVRPEHERTRLQK